MSTALERAKAKLAQYFDDPVGFAREFLDFEAHEGQQKWLRNSTCVENALVTGNRWGKSQTAAVKRIHKCVYRKGWTRRIVAKMDRQHEPYRSLNTSLTADQAGLVWRKAFALLQSPKAKWLVADVKMTPFPTIEFVTGAVFQARSTARDGVYLLGHDYDDANWDEAAFEKRFQYVLDNVLRMRLVDRGGILDFTSTGNGHNEFGRYFLTGLPGAENRDERLYSQTGSTFENPHVDHERLKVNMQRMSERMRRQNILGEIVESDGAYFEGADIDACTNKDLELRVHQYDEMDREAHASVFEDGKPWISAHGGNRFVHGWDLADKSDWTVGTTWDTTFKPKRMVEFERFHRQGWSHVYDRIRARHAKYGNSSTWVDSTGVGDVVLEELGDIGAQGVRFTRNVKDELLANVQSLLSLREIEFPAIIEFLEEMRFYEREDDGLITDCVMSLAVAANAPEMRHTAEAWYFSEIA